MESNYSFNVSFLAKEDIFNAENYILNVLQNKDASIMKNVPCKKSPQCGEEYFSVDVLDKINSNMKNKYNNKEKVNLLDYSKTA